MNFSVLLPLFFYSTRLFPLRPRCGCLRARQWVGTIAAFSDLARANPPGSRKAILEKKTK